MPRITLLVMARKLKVEYDKDRCIGRGNCAAIAPGYFKLTNKKAALLNSDYMSKNLYTKELECGKETAKSIIDAGIACPVNAIRVTDMEKNKDIVSFKVNEDAARKVIAHYNDMKDFVIDSKKYLLIRLDRGNSNIEVGFCNKKNNVILKVIGKKPVEIYQTVINKEKIRIRKDHAAYLGKELQKAYTALKHNLEYVQDEELDLNRKINR